MTDVKFADRLRKEPYDPYDCWVCPNCGNASNMTADRCTDVRWYSGEGWVETACGAPKPDWIDDE